MTGQDSGDHFTPYTRLNPDATGRFKRPGTASQEVPRPTRSQTFVEKLLFATFGLLIVVGAIAVWASYSDEHKAVPNTIAEAMKRDRVNVLIIGVGGEQHPGGGKDLADAILFLSLKPSTHQVAVISVPRDFWVRVGTYGPHRLNQAHAIGNEGGYPGEGPGLLGDTVSQMFGQPVDGFVRIDFKAFEQIINDLGGVDVYCQRPFYDYLFRDGFARGWHHLDGKRALAYARYRYILGPEGDNFARELRQQQVIQAVREKAGGRSPQDFAKMMMAMSTMSKATETNITTAQAISLYRTFHDVRRENVRNVSLKPFTQVFQVTRLTDPGQAVRTRTGDYSELQALARDIFHGNRQISTEDQIRLTAIPAPKPQPQAMLMSLP